jgi:LPS export ABC transporter permease LptF/LPS export ABC transporter permease LptG
MPRHLLARYLIKEALPFSILSLLILTGLILGQRTSREFNLLSASLTPTWLSLQPFLYLLPAIIPITLPFALLLGTIISLNRLSADSEITAIRASGISHFRLALPLVSIGLVGTLLSLILTWHYTPLSLKEIRNTKTQLLQQAINTRLQPRVFNTQFPGILIYLQDSDPASGDWRGVFLVRQHTSSQSTVLTAASGRLQLTGFTPYSIEVQLSNGKSLEANHQAAKYSLASFSKLTIRLSDPMPAATAPSAAQIPIPERDTSQLIRLWAGARGQQDKEHLTTTVELHKRLAIPFACLVLVLIASSPTSHTSRYTGRAAGVSIGFAIATTYYLISIGGQNLALSGWIPPGIGVWLANITGAVYALLPTYTRNKAVKRLTPSSMMSSGIIRRKLATSQVRKRRLAGSSPTRLPTLINYLLSSELTKYCTLALIILTTLSLIFTLFDLIPAIARNQTSLQYVSVYLAYLTPQLAYYVTPFALLLSITITFNLLSRTNQITALSASGQSHWQMILPLLPITATLSILLFTLSENILPWSNREQDARYATMKGRQMPQAALAFGQRWVYSRNHTIYNYQIRESDNQLLNTTAYQLNPTELQLISITHTPAAYPLTPTTWRTTSGQAITIKDQALAPSVSDTLEVPEGTALLKRTAYDPAKMSLTDLREYLQHLSQIGAPTTSIRLDMEKKRAFPLACLTLAILALPFALANNRRGTLAGIGVSIGISLAFWVTSSLVEAIGRQGLLPIGLAVWGTHAFFLALGGYLFFSRRH